jgi:hypothetical protein
MKQRFRPNTKAKANKEKNFKVYYRTGGTYNFKWQFVNGVYSYAYAMEKARELSDQGYKALFADSDVIQKIGLPTTFYITEMR